MSNFYQNIALFVGYKIKKSLVFVVEEKEMEYVCECNLERTKYCRNCGTKYEPFKVQEITQIKIPSLYNEKNNNINYHNNTEKFDLYPVYGQYFIDGVDPDYFLIGKQIFLRNYSDNEGDEVPSRTKKIKIPTKENIDKLLANYNFKEFEFNTYIIESN